MDRVIRNAPEALLGFATVASVALIVYLTRDMTFIQDTWEFLMNRREVTTDSLLAPHNEHIVVIPVMVEQLFLRAFGMTSATPEYVLLAVLHAATAILLFLYARRRAGPWLALFAALLLLFLGPAWEVILWPFEIGFIGSVLFGIAMLLALDRDDRDGDLAACLFLALSFGFSSVAIPFAAGAAVDVLQKRRERGLRRAYLVAAPLALYALWYLGWGSDAETHLSLDNVLSSPGFVFNSASAAAGAVFGIAADPLGWATDLVWARSLLVALIVAFALWQLYRRRLVAGFWPIAAVAAANWLLTAFNQAPGRDPASSRYQYMGGVLILLLLANLLQGSRLGRRGTIVAAALTAAVLAVNLPLLRDGRDLLRAQSELTRAELAAIEIASRTVDPAFSLNPDIAGTATLVDVQAAKYLPAVEEYGSPAHSPAELAAAPDYARRQADVVLSWALPLSLFTRRGAYDASGGLENCVRLAGGERRELALPAGRTRIEVAPGPPADLSLRRFATGEYPVATGGAPGGSATLLRVPRDGAPGRPWHLRVEASQPVRVCR